MKNYLLLSLATLGVMSFSALNAQTCNTPTTLSSNSTVTGNSCTAPTGTGDNTIGTLCNGLSNTGPIAVYTWTHGTGAVSGSITVTPTTAWNPAIVVGDGADCSSALGGFCDDQQDSFGNGSGASFAETTQLSNASANNKTFFLVISSFAASPAQACGPYSIQAGTLPVKLQKFSVK